MLGVFRTTAYCPCIKCCGNTEGITASGTKATANRTVGVDPSIIPFGTKLLIDGQLYIAEDSGAVKGEFIDIFHETHDKALEYGVQYKEVYIVNES